MQINLTFENLKCPQCSTTVNTGSTYVGKDTLIVKYCPDCDFRFIILVPPRDGKEYDLEYKFKPVK